MSLPGELPPAENLGFVHRLEPATNAQAPALLLLHGTGGDENTLIALGKAIAPGAALLSPRGKVLEQGMARFSLRPASGKFDQQDLLSRTDDLAAFVKQSAADYTLPANRLVVVAYSSGATIAISLLFHSPEMLAGAIIMRGIAPFAYPPAANLNRRPVLILAGLDDPYVASDEVEELANLFRSANAEVTLHSEETGHSMVQGDVLMAFDWLRRFYSAPKPPAAK